MKTPKRKIQGRVQPTTMNMDTVTRENLQGIADLSIVAHSMIDVIRGMSTRYLELLQMQAAVAAAGGRLQLVEERQDGSTVMRDLSLDLRL